MTFLFLIAAGLVYMFDLLPKSIQFVQIIFFSKKEEQTLNHFFITSFSYYKLLNAKEKRKFLLRVSNIRNRNQLKISPEIKNTNHEVELLICAAFTQITFGYTDYEMESFTKIVVNPNTFYSRLANHEVKGLTTGSGYIFYSWEDFLKGYSHDSDKVNLALHELAHALYIDRFHNRDNSDWEQWKIKATAVLEMIENNTELIFFRKYGKRNINEFWAVSVECFFEDPINFKKQHQYLYHATATILKQDMAERAFLQKDYLTKPSKVA